MAPTMDRNQCDACGLTFDSEEEMKKHERAYHSHESGSKEGEWKKKTPEPGQAVQDEPKRKAS